MSSHIASAFAGVLALPRAVADRANDARIAVRDQVQVIRDGAPTITTALLIAAMLTGAAVCWPIASWWGSVAEGKRWKTEIAASSAAVRAAIGAGNSAIDAEDETIINALRATDAKATAAEDYLASSRNAPAVDGCARIPAQCLQLD